MTYKPEYYDLTRYAVVTSANSIIATFSNRIPAEVYAEDSSLDCRVIPIGEMLIQ